MENIRSRRYFSIVFLMLLMLGLNKLIYFNLEATEPVNDSRQNNNKQPKSEDNSQSLDAIDNLDNLKSQEDLVKQIKNDRKYLKNQAAYISYLIRKDDLVKALSEILDITNKLDNILQKKKIKTFLAGFRRVKKSKFNQVIDKLLNDLPKLKKVLNNNLKDLKRTDPKDSESSFYDFKTRAPDELDFKIIAPDELVTLLIYLQILIDNDNKINTTNDESLKNTRSAIIKVITDLIARSPLNYVAFLNLLSDKNSDIFEKKIQEDLKLFLLNGPSNSYLVSLLIDLLDNLVLVSPNDRKYLDELLETISICLDKVEKNISNISNFDKQTYLRFLYKTYNDTEKKLKELEAKVTDVSDNTTLSINSAKPEESITEETISKSPETIIIEEKRANEVANEVSRVVKLVNNSKFISRKDAQDLVGILENIPKIGEDRYTDLQLIQEIDYAFLKCFDEKTMDDSNFVKKLMESIQEIESDTIQNNSKLYSDIKQLLISKTLERNKIIKDLVLIQRIQKIIDEQLVVVNFEKIELDSILKGFFGLNNSLKKITLTDKGQIELEDIKAPDSIEYSKKLDEIYNNIFEKVKNSCNFNDLKLIDLNLSYIQKFYDDTFKFEYFNPLLSLNPLIGALLSKSTNSISNSFDRKAADIKQNLTKVIVDYYLTKQYTVYKQNYLESYLVDTIKNNLTNIYEYNDKVVKNNMIALMISEDLTNSWLANLASQRQECISDDKIKSIATNAINNDVSNPDLSLLTKAINTEFTNVKKIIREAISYKLLSWDKYREINEIKLITDKSKQRRNKGISSLDILPPYIVITGIAAKKLYEPEVIKFLGYVDSNQGILPKSLLSAKKSDQQALLEKFNEAHKESITLTEEQLITLISQGNLTNLKIYGGFSNFSCYLLRYSPKHEFIVLILANKSSKDLSSPSGEIFDPYQALLTKFDIFKDSSNPTVESVKDKMSLDTKTAGSEQGIYYKKYWQRIQSNLESTKDSRSFNPMILAKKTGAPAITLATPFISFASFTANLEASTSKGINNSGNLLNKLSFYNYGRYRGLYLGLATFSRIFLIALGWFIWNAGYNLSKADAQKQQERIFYDKLADNILLLFAVIIFIAITIKSLTFTISKVL